MPRERPILFNGEIVRAVLDGTKTQTRRVLPVVYNGPPDLVECAHPPRTWDFMGQRQEKWGIRFRGTYPCAQACPYGQPGDMLWVRETWCKYPGDEHPYEYRADNPDPTALKWRPSIHMPRRASRLTLRVTDVRVERVQDISEEDARAEGVDGTGSLHPVGRPLTCREDFRALWDSINANRGFGWSENPWVWVVCFERAR